MDKLLWIYVCILCSVVHTFAGNFTTCDRDYEKMGCFERNLTTMKMLITDRDPTSSAYDGHMVVWNFFGKSIHSLACRCSEKAKKSGYTYFSIRYFAECWAGKDISELNAILNDKSKQVNECPGSDFSRCQDESESECAGDAHNEYMFKISESIDGGYSDWSSWTKCLEKCGFKSRKRECTNPAPKGSGKDCSGIGESTETEACDWKTCAVDIAIESKGFGRQSLKPRRDVGGSRNRGLVVVKRRRRIDGDLTDISIGDGKIMGVDRAKKILYRTGVDTSHPLGTKWKQIDGALKQISVGDGKIMGVNRHDQIYFRTGVDAHHPYGRKWKRISGNLKEISVGDGKIMGVGKGDKVWFRKGVDTSHPFGTDWKAIRGARLKQISVGDGKMMGVNKADQIYFRTGVDASNPSGTGWKTIDGHLKQISIKDGKIIGVNRQNHIFLRKGVDASHACGTRWVKIAGSLKYVDAGDGKIMGITKKGKMSAVR